MSGSISAACMQLHCYTGRVVDIMADLFTCSTRHLSMLISAPFVTRLELSAQHHRVCAQFSDCLIIWISSSFALYLYICKMGVV